MTIFIDLDGTLIDVSKRHHYIYQKIIRKLGGKPLNKNYYWKLKRNKTDWKKILQKSSIPEKLTQQFLKEFIGQIEQPDNLKYDSLFTYTKSALKKLSQNHNLYLISLRHHRKYAINQLENLKINEYFKSIIIGLKNNNGYKITKDHLNQKSIIIGDTEADILTAQKFGLTSIAVISGIRNKRFLQNLKPDFIVNDLRNAVNIINNLNF